MLITVTQTVSNSTATLANYRYDGDNARYQQIDFSSGVTTTYHNDIIGLSQVLIADDGTNQTANIFGLDLISSNDGTTTLTMLPDGLGSVRVEMQGGAVNSVTTYEPYGTLLMQTGSSGTVYGYTGEQMDRATGLTYLRARYYNPSLHRFQTKDPWAGNIYQPYTLNGFNYGNGNPVRYVDLSGLCGADIGDLGMGKILTEACEALRDTYEAKYSIHINGNWTYSEMEMIGPAFEDMEYVLGSTGFRLAFDGTTLNRLREEKVDGYKAVTKPQSAGFAKIIFANETFPDRNFARWTVLHEFGHVWDNTRVSSEFFPEVVNLSCLLLSSNFDPRWQIFHRADLEGAASLYGQGAVGEDFAETWAYLFFNGSRETLKAQHPDRDFREPSLVRKQLVIDSIADFLGILVFFR